MRVGILGGSFNPPHRGHLAVAQAVQAALGLDAMLLVPAARPPHKPGDPDLAPPEDRLAMTRLAAATCGFEVSDIELRRAGPSYTIDTVRELKAARPGDAFFFVIGSDTVDELPTWKDGAALLREAAFVTVNRPGHDMQAGIDIVARELGEDLAQDLRERVVTMEPVPISATAVRRKVREGTPGWADDVPPAVAEYIEAHGLYREE